MRHLALILIFLVPITAFSQVIGNTFPTMTAETVNDEEITVPDDTKGKYTLLGLAYSKKSEDDLNGWFSPVYYKFVHEPENPGLFDAFRYDVNVYFIPMFTGVKASAQGIAKKKALKNVDPKLFPHMLFYKGELKKYKQALDFEKKDIPYFFVLNEEGQIVYATSGKFTEDKLDEIEENLE